LNKLLPTTLPIAILPCPEIEALTLTTNSGELVPKATMVNPATNGETPALSARDELPFTSQEAPKYNRTSDARTKKMESSIV